MCKPGQYRLQGLVDVVTAAAAFLPIALIAAQTVQAQPSARRSLDTIAVACSIDVPDPRRCAVVHLARRVQARLGASEALQWTPSQSSFTSSTEAIPARVLYETTPTAIVARAIIAYYPPPSPAPGLEDLGVGRSTPPAAAPTVPVRAGEHRERTSPARVARPLLTTPAAPILVMHGPMRVPVIVGREKPVLVTFVLADSNLSSAAPSGRTLSGALTPVASGVRGACRSGWFNPVDIADTRIDVGGMLSCYIRLPADVDPTSALHFTVTLTVGRRTIRREISVDPVVVTTYGVEAVASCAPVVNRLKAMLVARGVPVVSFGKAARRVSLTSCERVDRLAPIAVGHLAPVAYAVLGMIDEHGVSVYDDPTKTGPISLTTTKPGADPVAEIATMIADRLMKYSAL